MLRRSHFSQIEPHVLIILLCTLSIITNYFCTHVYNFEDSWILFRPCATIEYSRFVLHYLSQLFCNLCYPPCSLIVRQFKTLTDKGHIIEIGSHSELMDNKGLYYEF